MAEESGHRRQRAREFRADAICARNKREFAVLPLVVTTFDESTVVRDQVGKFAPNSTSASSAVLDDPYRAQVDAEREMLELIDKTARIAVGSRNLDRGEIASELTVRYYDKLDKLPEGQSIENAGSYLHTIAGGLVQHETVGTSRGPDITAVKMLAQRVHQIEAEEDRVVGSAERERIAVAIRDSFPAGKRPRENFWRRGSSDAAASLDALSADTDTDGYDRFGVEDSHGDSEYLNTLTRWEQLQETRPAALARGASKAEREEHGRQAAQWLSQQSELRREVWSAVVAQHGAPAIGAVPMTREDMSGDRSLIAAAGGPSVVASRLDDPALDSRVKAAFLRPFRASNDDDGEAAEGLRSVFAGRSDAQATRLHRFAQECAAARAARGDASGPRIRVRSAGHQVAAAPARLNSQQRRSAQAAVSRVGVAKLAAAIRDGRPVPKQMFEAFTAPFSAERLSTVEYHRRIRQVAAQLADSSDAEQVWGSALERTDKFAATRSVA